MKPDQRNVFNLMGLSTDWSISMIALASKVDKSCSLEEQVVKTAVEFYNQAVTAYKSLGSSAARQVDRWQKILLEIEDQDAFLNAILLYHEAMMKELRGEVPPILPNDDEGPEPYNNLTLSQRRGKYLAEYAELHKIKSLKTSEARAVLQTVEKVRLKPTQIIRALHEASKWLNSKLDHFGPKKENRLKIIDSPFIKPNGFFKFPDLPNVLRSDPS